MARSNKAQKKLAAEIIVAEEQAYQMAAEFAATELALANQTPDSNTPADNTTPVVLVKPSQYPQGQERVILRPLTKTVGSGIQAHWDAIQATIEAFGTDGHITCEILAAKVASGRRAIRRVARAGGLAYYSPFKARYGLGKADVQYPDLGAAEIAAHVQNGQ